MKKHIDLPLLAIALLLASTLTAYALGVFAYPFGFFILCLLFLGRYLQLKAKA